MLFFIVLLLAGSVLAYLSQQNVMLVAVRMGPYIISDVPLFYVIISSLITGLVLAYVLHVSQVISSRWVLRGKEKQLRENKSEVLELTKRVHQLELEKEKIKNGTLSEPTDPLAL